MTAGRCEEVARLLSNPSTVIFVGSGVSIWSGLPAWPSLISDLIDKAEAIEGKPLEAARAHFRKNDLIAAASILEKSLEANVLATFLRDDVGFGSARPQAIHSLITSFPTNCYITTNFDSLIENQITISTGIRPKIVTNLDYVDMPSITRADATRFVFKPHGDIDRCESIVLSQNRYLSGLAGPGAQSAAVAALSILMASRPVVFVGYSISDVDIQIVIRAMRDIFGGSGPPLWAIMPDLPENDADVLRAMYGIRVIHYTVLENRDGSLDHSNLVTLLELLHDKIPKVPSSIEPEIDRLEIARYGSRLARLESATSINLEVRIREDGSSHEYYPGRTESLPKTLRDSPRSYIIVGPAGSGKSFAIRNYAAGVGAELREWGISETQSDAKPVVPILLDARLYAGSFEELYRLTVPQHLTPRMLSAFTTPELILDSLDEMPAKFLEAGEWVSDLERLSNALGSPRMLIASRREELVARPELPRANLIGLSDAAIRDELRLAKIDHALLNEDLLELLKTPFMIKAAAEVAKAGFSIISSQALLRDLLHTRLSRLTGHSSDTIIAALKQCAYHASEAGADTISLDDVRRAFNSVGIADVDAKQITNDLIDGQVIVSEIRDSIRFIHRAVLEYLASLQLITKLQDGSATVAGILYSRRWDNVLTWCMSGMIPEEAEPLLGEIYCSDAALALKIARNAEVDGHVLMAWFLKKLVEDPNVSPSVDYEISRTAFPLKCKIDLRTLSRRGDTLGQSAAEALLPLLDEDERYSIIAEITASGETFFPTGYTYSLFAKTMDADERARALAEIAGSPRLRIVEPGEGDRRDERIGGVLSGLLEVDEALILGWARHQNLEMREFICQCLWKHTSPSVIKFLIDQWDLGSSEAIFPLYLKVRWDDANVAIAPTMGRMRAIVSKIRKFQDKDYSLDLLTVLNASDAAWSRLTMQFADKTNNSNVALALKMAVRSERRSTVGALIDGVSCGALSSKVARYLARALEDEDLDDSMGNILELLAVGNVQVLNVIFKSVGGIAKKKDLGSEQIVSMVDSLTRIGTGGEARNQLLYRICHWLAASVNAEGARIIIDMANDPSKDRTVLFRWVMLFMAPSSFSTDDLTDEACLRFLGTYLNASGPHEAHSSPGDFASERFIKQYVFPICDLGFDRKKRTRINEVLVAAGGRHGVRYPLLDGGEVPGSRSRGTIVV